MDKLARLTRSATANSDSNHVGQTSASEGILGVIENSTDWAKEVSMMLNLAYERGHRQGAPDEYFTELDQLSREFRQHCKLFTD